MKRTIRRLREAKGWTQAELAHQAGLRGAPSISELENGKGNPTLDTLQAIAAALDIDVATLVATSSDPEVSEALEKTAELMVLFRQLPEEDQERLLDLAHVLLRASPRRPPEGGSNRSRKEPK